MNKTFFTRLLALLLLAPLVSRADEGMWLPLLLKQLNESDMQKRGLKLSAEDIYSINKTSLKDAIVLFGGGCTGEMISGEGLLLTNHHCGYGQIQSHSSVEKDYLTNGFWAMNRSEELANQGLTATFIVRMEDVTAQVLKDMPANLAEAEREKRAKIIHAQGEFEASQRLSDAAVIIEGKPVALQLRYLQTLTEIGMEKNTTIVFPLPIDILEYFGKHGNGAKE